MPHRSAAAGSTARQGRRYPNSASSSHIPPRKKKYAGAFCHGKAKDKGEYGHGNARHGEKGMLHIQFFRSFLQHSRFFQFPCDLDADQRSQRGHGDNSQGHSHGGKRRPVRHRRKRAVRSLYEPVIEIVEGAATGAYAAWRPQIPRHPFSYPLNSSTISSIKTPFKTLERNMGGDIIS